MEGLRVVNGGLRWSRKQRLKTTGDSNLHEAELEIENAGRTWWKLGKVK